ncbi:MAG: hypothetical protein OEY72_08530, partial [Gammaproteobacteria bacterium]|nr:hypothetical protein [Gammaproteobacteria bacterium]
MLRLRRKHSQTTPAPAIDAAALLNAQAPGRALLAAVGIAALMNMLWLWLSDLTGHFFHAFSLLQGPMIGLAVRRAGHGIDWRFPSLAASVAVLAAVSGNFLVSLTTTAVVLDATALQVLRGLTVWTWQTWYAEVLSTADFIYALFAAAVAA